MRPSPIEHDVFIDCESLDALQRHYTEHFEAFEKRDAFLERAQQDWREVAFAKAKDFAEPPETLPAVVCEAGGLRYHVYGVIHGLLGGSERDYKDFVEATVGALDHTLFENGLHHFYPSKSHTVIPDFQVLGIPGSLGIGFEVGRLFPRLLWEGLTEVLKLGKPSEGFEAYDYSKVFHAVPPETRRGLEEWPPLPSRLQIEYEMGEFGRTFSRLRNPYLISPRSLYMAGFAHGFANGLCG